MKATLLQKRLCQVLDGEIRRLQRSQQLIMRTDVEVLDAAMELFGETEATAQWLSHGQRALGGKTPLAIARRAKGAKQVIMVIRAIEHGVYL